MRSDGNGARDSLCFPWIGAKNYLDMDKVTILKKRMKTKQILIIKKVLKV